MSHVDKFTISCTRDERLLEVTVYLYDNIDDLRAACKRYDKDCQVDSIGAITHSYNRIRYAKNGDWELNKDVGKVRMLKTVGMAVSSHELLHAACNMYRVFGMDSEGNTCEVSLHDMDNEELLAYILSDLAYDFGTKMVERKHW